MSRLSRALVALLVLLIVSPFTAPLSSCDLSLLVASVVRPPATATATPTGDARHLYDVELVAGQGDDSRRLKDDSTWRLPAPTVASHAHPSPQFPRPAVRRPPALRAVPLVLRI